METNFWTQLLATVASVAGATKYYFYSKRKTNQQKANLDMDVERFRDTAVGKLITALENAVTRIVPAVARHEKLLAQNEIDLKLIQATQVKLLEMGKDLKLQYDNFQTRIDNAKAGGNVILGRVEKIETELSKLKTGNIYVKNKK